MLENCIFIERVVNPKATVAENIGIIAVIEHQNNLNVKRAADWLRMIEILNSSINQN